MKLTKNVVIFSVLIIAISNIFGQSNLDTIVFERKQIAEELCSNSQNMLNYYRTNDCAYMDDGFYLLNENKLQYAKGFFCLATDNLLNDENKNEGYSYVTQLTLLTLEYSNLSHVTILSYTEIKSKKLLLKQLNSKKVQNINYPKSMIGFTPNFPITEERLKVCFSKYNNVNITAVRIRELDFKRYVFDGKKMKLIFIPFYYIIRMDIDGYIIRDGKTINYHLDR